MQKEKELKKEIQLEESNAFEKVGQKGRKIKHSELLAQEENQHQEKGEDTEYEIYDHETYGGY